MRLVVDEELGEAVQVERYLGDHRPVHPGEVRGDERGLAGVPAEQLDDGEAFVAPALVRRLWMNSTPRVTAVENPMQ